MEFAIPAVANASDEIQAANRYPHIRIFSVGHRTQSAVSLRDLQTVWEPWQVASNASVAKDASPGHTLFSTFSAVCWLFGRRLSDALTSDAANATGGDGAFSSASSGGKGAGALPSGGDGAGALPLGLISANWGGTTLEQWAPNDAYPACRRTPPFYHGGPMWNGVLSPYAAGPMALAGFTFYQGEDNTRDAQSAAQYACLFPQVVSSWRRAFVRPDAFFGFIQLSTWCSPDAPQAIPLMRDAQLAALRLPNVGFATNADHGMGCNIHPSAKQYCARRLANAALALRYGKTSLAWRSPAYEAATPLPLRVVSADEEGGGEGGEEGGEAEGGPAQRRGGRGWLMVRLAVSLSDVPPGGLKLIHPYNYASPGYGSDASASPPVLVNCTGTFPRNATANASMLTQCAWASLHVQGAGWLNASVDLDATGRGLVLSARLPASLATASDGTARGAPAAAAPKVIGSAVGWGPIPMLTAYTRGGEEELPVLPWNVSERVRV